MAVQEHSISAPWNECMSRTQVCSQALLADLELLQQGGKCGVQEVAPCNTVQCMCWQDLFHARVCVAATSTFSFEKGRAFELFLLYNLPARLYIKPNPILACARLNAVERGTCMLYQPQIVRIYFCKARRLLGQLLHNVAAAAANRQADTLASRGLCVCGRVRPRATPSSTTAHHHLRIMLTTPPHPPTFQPLPPPPTHKH